MDNRYKYRLKKNESKLAINEDSFSQLSFNNERRLLPVGEINHIVDLGKEFNKERNSSFIYRLQGTVNPLFSNPLMNPNENSTSSSLNKLGNGLDIFEHNLFTKPQIGNDIEYPEAYSKYLIERDGWFGFTEPDITKPGLCDFYYIEPGKDKFDLNSNIPIGSSINVYSPKKNWEITVTYPYASDSGHTVVSDAFHSINGLLIIQALSVIVGGNPMIALATATRHGLESGDRVKITNPYTSVIPNGEYTVKRLGLDNGDYIENYFVIDINPTGLLLSSTVPVSVELRLQKIVSGQLSVYYLRKFKKLVVNNGDYEMYPLAFSSTIFNDGNYQFIINQDIDLEGLTDNLGRPISELYLTFIKTDSNGTFGPLKSGLDLENLQHNKDNLFLSNARIIHDGPTTFVPDSNNPLETQLYDNYITNGLDEFYGDVVEYNKFTLTETLLADVLHRFNTKKRENSTNIGTARGPRREGYLYKPHHLYQIREFSSYIEQGDSLTNGIPDYAEDLGDGRFLWRDYLDIGFSDGANEGVEYPFTNAAHYMHKNVCFMTTRQDPYNNYGLYYDGSNISGFGAAATATIDTATGEVDSITVSNGGSSYTTAPSVIITGGGGSGAAATATIDTATGEVDSITVSSGGSSYITAPSVIIDSFDPADPIGDAITDNFTVKSSQNVC